MQLKWRPKHSCNAHHLSEWYVYNGPSIRSKGDPDSAYINNQSVPTRVLASLSFCKTLYQKHLLQNVYYKSYYNNHNTAGSIRISLFSWIVAVRTSMDIHHKTPSPSLPSSLWMSVDWQNAIVEALHLLVLPLNRLWLSLQFLLDNADCVCT